MFHWNNILLFLNKYCTLNQGEKLLSSKSPALRIEKNDLYLFYQNTHLSSTQLLLTVHLYCRKFMTLKFVSSKQFFVLGLLFFFYNLTLCICLPNLFINCHNMKVNLTPISILGIEYFILKNFVTVITTNNTTVVCKQCLTCELKQLCNDCELGINRPEQSLFI